jgi:hypothetical protein
VLPSSQSRSAYEGSPGRIAPGIESAIAGHTILTGGKTVPAKLEVVVDRSVNREKLLGLPDRLEPLHVAFPSSGRLVRDFTAIVEVPALPMFNTRQDLASGSPIGSKFIGHNDSGHVAQALEQLAKETLGGLLVAAALNQHVEHVAMLIDGPPEIVQFASDADKHLIQKPVSPGRGRHRLRLLA